MQDEIEVVLVGIEFLALDVVENVFLSQWVQPKDVADGAQIAWIVSAINVGPAC